MVFELRQYRCQPGQRAALVELTDGVIIPFQPFQASHGTAILGSWTAEEDADLYVWLRRFDDEAHR
jgi:hypothetical protein